MKRHYIGYEGDGTGIRDSALIKYMEDERNA